ncbi:MAG: CNNM domain-containing protein, partial [Pirellulaceae bacterium]
MNSLLELWPWLLAMVMLIGLSAFFSASEAALFLLRAGDRRRLETGTAGQRMAARLLDEPDRLLSAVLFWNLVINIIYFAISSVVALRMQTLPLISQAVPVAFALGSLIMIIFFSEMMPKSLAVIRPSTIARLVSIPLSLAVRAADPIMPILRGATLLSRRLIWPGFKPEPYIELLDLERAIQISSEDKAIIEQETAVLRN